jgi:hypothetical protein
VWLKWLEGLLYDCKAVSSNPSSTQKKKKKKKKEKASWKTKVGSFSCASGDGCCNYTKKGAMCMSHTHR